MPSPDNLPPSFWPVEFERTNSTGNTPETVEQPAYVDFSTLTWRDSRQESYFYDPEEGLVLSLRCNAPYHIHHREVFTVNDDGTTFDSWISELSDPNGDGKVIPESELLIPEAIREKVRSLAFFLNTETTITWEGNDFYFDIALYEPGREIVSIDQIELVLDIVRTRLSNPPSDN